jgi:hypothetical protein
VVWLGSCNHKFQLRGNFGRCRLASDACSNLSYARCLGDNTLSAFQKAGLPSVAQPESCKTATVTKWRSSVAFSIFSVPVIRSSPFLHSNFNRFQSLPAKSRIDRDVISALEVVVGNGSVTAKQLGALDDVHHLDA